MPEQFDDKDRDQLVALDRIKEYLEKEELPKITPDEAQRFLQEAGNIKKTIEDLLSETVDPQTGAVDVSVNPETGLPRHVTEFSKEELLQLLQDRIDYGLKVEKQLDEAEQVIRQRIEPIKEKLAVDTSKKTASGRAIPGGSILKQSIRRLFGENTDQISYDMYNKALELRALFRQEDLENALKDSPIGIGENIVTAARRRKSEQSE